MVVKDKKKILAIFIMTFSIVISCLIIFVAINKANEIKVDYKDRKTIFDLAIKYPNATFILDMRGTEEPEDWNEISRLNIICKNNFILAVGKFLYVNECKQRNIKYYYTFPVNTLYELKALEDAGCEYALIDAPLTHMLPTIKEKYSIKLRMVPNVAYYSYISHSEGVCGSWFRPEDSELYSQYIDAIEFEDCNLKKEQALYRLYGEGQEWGGDISVLITNLNVSANNKMIPPEFAQARIKCGQRCLSGAHCKLCYNYLKLANPDLLEQYLSNN